jgi:hypothetical protein
MYRGNSGRGKAFHRAADRPVASDKRELEV